MLEIYNESINDLLYEGKPENAPKHEVKLVKEGSKEVRPEAHDPIHLDSKKNPFL